MVRRSGSTLHWGIDGPADILRAVPGVRLLSWLRWFQSDTYALLPLDLRVKGRLMALIPAPKHAIANMAQYHRYAFGKP